MTSILKLGTTYQGRDHNLLERILPFVDYIEVTPDSITEIKNGGVVLHDPTVSELRNISHRAKILVHGIGLSIWSHDGYNENYFRLLDALLEKVDVEWHSEHLGYTTVDEDSLGTMLTLPRTEQVLDMLCERIMAIQDRYPIPFLLENVVSLLPEFEDDLSQAEFLNALTVRTGCGLVLDVYNLECDAHNLSFNIPAFLNELNLQRVSEIHVAQGVEHSGFLLDIHSRVTRASTLNLAELVIARAEGAVKTVTYEVLPEAVPVLGFDVIEQELTRLHQRFLNDN